MADKQAQLLDTVIALRKLMSNHDNTGYALRADLGFIGEEANKIRKEAHESATNTANKVHELLQEIEKSKLYREMATREKRRRKLHGSEDT